MVHLMPKVDNVVGMKLIDPSERSLAVVVQATAKTREQYQTYWDGQPLGSAVAVPREREGTAEMRNGRRSQELPV